MYNPYNQGFLEVLDTSQQNLLDSLQPYFQCYIVQNVFLSEFQRYIELYWLLYPEKIISKAMIEDHISCLKKFTIPSLKKEAIIESCHKLIYNGGKTFHKLLTKANGYFIKNENLGLMSDKNLHLLSKSIINNITEIFASLSQFWFITMLNNLTNDNEFIYFVDPYGVAGARICFSCP